ncbi:MAG: DUF3592 domain-containing protein [Anaerolineales bacterium]|nr:DUF3592 domain-containing protein [Anaerolineales bacterium]
MNNFDENLDKAVESYEKNFDKVANTVDKVATGVNRLRIGCITLFVNLFLAAFCLWGAYAASVSWKLQSTGEVTTGTVTRLEESKTSEGYCCLYTPVVEFQANGQTYSVENGSASDSVDYTVGSDVQIRYDPANPNTAQIDNVMERWLFPVLIIPSMIFAALITNFFAFRSWRQGDESLYE